jgi:hypothetical protein
VKQDGGILTVFGIRAQRWPIYVIILGLGLVVGGVQYSHFTGLVEYTYSVEPVTQAVATEAAEASSSEGNVIFQFTELSASAQDAFLRAYESTDNYITIRGMEHQATELGHYGDTPTRSGDGLNYVVYQGDYYEFTIRNPMSIEMPGSLIGYPLAVIGSLLGIYGSLKHEPRTRPLLALSSGVAVFLAVYSVTGWWGLNDFLLLLVVGGLCAYLPAIGVWSSYGVLRS